MSGHSWLWGDCGTESYSYTIPCADDPDFFPLPTQQYEESNRVMIARKMTELELLGYSIKSEWKNVHELQNKTILTEAVTFRLSLAGYTYDPEWENLEMEPCPVPSPTQEIKIPQSYTFINAECNQSLSIFPNPNGGTFTLLLPNYKDVVSLEIIRDLDMSMIYSKFQAFVNESEPISLSSPLPGYYTIRVRTLTGTIYSKLLIQ